MSYAYSVDNIGTMKRDVMMNAVPAFLHIAPQDPTLTPTLTLTLTLTLTPTLDPTRPRARAGLRPVEPRDMRAMATALI